MTVWQPVILTVPVPPVLLILPRFHTGVSVHDLRDLAFVQALAAAATPRPALAMDQPGVYGGQGHAAGQVVPERIAARCFVD